MKIAIIGGGNVGGALAQQLIKVKHTVLVGTKFPLSQKLVALATKIGEDRFNTIDSVVKQCDVIMLAVPAASVIDVAKSLGNVSDKIMIDATNGFYKCGDAFTSSTEAIPANCNCTDVVKCFNTTGFENMLNPVYNNEPADMFVAAAAQQQWRLPYNRQKIFVLAKCMILAATIHFI